MEQVLYSVVNNCEVHMASLVPKFFFNLLYYLKQKQNKTNQPRLQEYLASTRSKWSENLFKDFTT